MDWSEITTKTYDDSAEELARYFVGIGARVKDVELGLKLAKKTNQARVVEIGCGDGRDAKEIVKRVAWYEGFDPSIGMLSIARKKLPKTSFVLADALSYKYPQELDVVYAFASLLHVNKADLKTVLQQVAKSLNQDGIFYISLKERRMYTKETKNYKYGQRMFYFYNVNVIKDMADRLFTLVYEDHQKIGQTDWFTVALKKL